ncbi:unnamed protein product [Cylicocyclus nassatus]|uniref:Uncharacterized protein n=1 Tax=Cylicocyclus nassatus TaxID=53992 RepID=A0AA36HCD6_CYLNA|nr:unnamed protein product [Cylicocyclus nassatus]
MLLAFSLLALIAITCADLVDIACERNPSLRYCKGRNIRRKEPRVPEDPFEEKFRPHESHSTDDDDDDISLELEDTTIRPRRSTTPVPLPRQNLMYTVFPTLQKEKDWRKYCPVNEYTFQTTCLPGKKLRYDLQIGGIMLNYGSELGVLGQKTGKGPARALNALTHGYPSFGTAPEPSNADKKASQEFLKSFGIPNIPGLNKIFNKLGGNKVNKRVRGYEPGYGAVNPNAPLALGKTDRDAVNLPGGIGDIEIEKGGGFGIGK